MLIDKLSNILNFQQLYLSPTNTLPIFIPELTDWTEATAFYTIKKQSGRQ